MAAEAIEIFSKTVRSARACRAYLSRVVSYLTTDGGITQFLDLGSGLPSARNVHEVAQAARTLDFGQPVAVMLLAVLHLSPNGEPTPTTPPSGAA